MLSLPAWSIHLLSMSVDGRRDPDAAHAAGTGLLAGARPSGRHFGMNALSIHQVAQMTTNPNTTNAVKSVSQPSVKVLLENNRLTPASQSRLKPMASQWTNI